MNTSELIINILFSLLITIFIYLLIPTILVLTKRKFKRRAIKFIVVINGIAGFIFFNVLRYIAGLESSANLAPVCLWSTVAYWMLIKLTLIDEKDTECTLNDNDKNDKMELSESPTVELTEKTEESVCTNIQSITEKTATKKIKFCSKCGAAIDYETKRCTGCGYQYFNGFKLKSIVIILLSILLFISLLLNIKNITEVEKLQNELGELNSMYEDLKGKNKDLDKEITSLEKQLSKNKYKLDFIDEYVVFIEDDGTDLYHTFECVKFKGSHFWVYNIAAAEDEGYKPCACYESKLDPKILSFEEYSRIIHNGN